MKKEQVTTKRKICVANDVLEAVEKHGAIIGSVLAVWRILRCNPFSKGGYDPVPEKINIGNFSCKFRRKNH